MNPTEYRKWCRRFESHRPEERLNALVHGLTSEAGEVAGLFEKAARHGGELSFEDVMDELGDVMWNVARIADELGFTLDEVMTNNINKLIERYTALDLPMNGQADA